MLRCRSLGSMATPSSCTPARYTCKMQCGLRLSHRCQGCSSPTSLRCFPVPRSTELLTTEGSASADLGPLKRQPSSKLLDVAGCGSWQGNQKRGRVRAPGCGNRKSGGLACQPWPPCVESKATWRPVRDHTGRSPSCAKPRAPLCDIRDIMLGVKGDDRSRSLNYICPCAFQLENRTRPRF